MTKEMLEYQSASNTVHQLRTSFNEILDCQKLSKEVTLENLVQNFVTEMYDLVLTVIGQENGLDGHFILSDGETANLVDDDEINPKIKAVSIQFMVDYIYRVTKFDNVRRKFAVPLLELSIFRFAVTQSPSGQRLLLENNIYKILDYLMENRIEMAKKGIWKQLLDSVIIKQVLSAIASKWASKDDDLKYGSISTSVFF